MEVICPRIANLLFLRQKIVITIAIKISVTTMMTIMGIAIIPILISLELEDTSVSDTTVVVLTIAELGIIDTLEVDSLAVTEIVWLAVLTVRDKVMENGVLVVAELLEELVVLTVADTMVEGKVWLAAGDEVIVIVLPVELVAFIVID